MSHQQPLRMNWDDLFRLILRHRKKLVVLPTLAVLLGLSIILFFPRTYRSQAKLFLQIGRESVGIDPTATVGQTIALQQSGRDNEVQSALEVLAGRGVIGAAVDELGPEIVLAQGGADGAGGKSNLIANAVGAVPRMISGWFQSLDPISQREEAIIQLERGLEFGAERDSAVIVIKYDAKTPQLAQQICDAVVKAYQREHLRIHNNPGSTTFFDDQQALLRKQVDEAEEGLRQMKDALGIGSIDLRRTTLETQYSAVTLNRYDAEQQLATALASVADLDQQLDKLPARLTSSKTSVPNEGGDMLQDQYYALRLKEMELKARYSDGHPLVQAVSQQVAQAKRVIDTVELTRDVTVDDINPISRDLSLDRKKQASVIAGLKARLTELDVQEKKILSDLRSINEAGLKIAQLERVAELARDKYRQYGEYLEEARIVRELQRERISNVSVVQPASFQEKPVGPKKLLVVLATMFLAMFGTAAAVLTSEQLHGVGNSIHANGFSGVPARLSMPEDNAELQLARNGESTSTNRLS